MGQSTFHTEGICRVEHWLQLPFPQHNRTKMSYRSGQAIEFGFPAGVAITDVVPERIRHLIHRHWENYPPVNPMWHYLLGVIYIFLGFFSIVGNCLVVYLYMKAPQLKTPTNMLVVNLAL